jgi:hypothetical protein
MDFKGSHLVGRPILGYQMTMHDGIEFEHYGSEHYVSEETLITHADSHRWMKSILKLFHRENRKHSGRNQLTDVAEDY